MVTTMDIIKDIAAVVGCITAIFTLFGIFTQKGQKIIAKIFAKHTSQFFEADEKQGQEIKEIKNLLKEYFQASKTQNDNVCKQLNILCESAKDMLRQRIMNYYYSGRQDRQLTIYEREALDELYKDYKTLNGNSYIDKYFNRMDGWEVVYSEEVEES